MTSIKSNTAPPAAAVPADADARRAIVARLVRGATSPTMALMYLLIQTRDTAAVSTLLATLHAQARPGSAALQRIAEAQQLITANHAGCERVIAMLRAEVDNDEPATSVDAGITFCRQLFDWSVSQSAEASVALYSLGNPAILAQATAEIVAQFAAWGVLGDTRHALEIGCGIGRFQVALAHQLAAITGIDVAEKMIIAAQERCAGLANVQLATCGGHDLAQFRDGRFDLVFAVDSFPYLRQSGLALVETHFHEAARVLKPRGDFIVLNYSYRNAAREDRAEVRRCAADAGFDILQNGTQPFALWDGVAFRLKRRR